MTLRIELAVITGLLSLANIHEGLSQTNVFRLTLYNRYQPTEIFVNGFPVYSATGTNQQTKTLGINAFLVLGTNLIDCVGSDTATNFSEIDFTSQQIQLDRTRDLSVDGDLVLMFERQVRSFSSNGLQQRVSFTNQGGFESTMVADIGSASVEIAIETTRREAIMKSSPGAGAYRVSAGLTLTNSPLLSLPWLGEASTISPADVIEIKDKVMMVYQAFTNHDASALTNLFAAKIERNALAKGLLVDEEATLRQQYFQRLFTESPLQIPPVDSTDLAVRTYPKVNLVQVLLHGQPPIQAIGNGFRYKLPLYLSKAAGHWVLVE